VSDGRLELLVNGEPRDVPPDCTVQGLLESLGITGKRVAVAINRDVVPRSTFGTHRLAPGDRIEILEAVGGG
jgi:sulfur carrier protein